MAYLRISASMRTARWSRRPGPVWVKVWASPTAGARNIELLHYARTGRFHRHNWWWLPLRENG